MMFLKGFNKFFLTGDYFGNEGFGYYNPIFNIEAKTKFRNDGNILCNGMQELYEFP